MIFKISRTNIWDEEVKPCEEAVIKMMPTYDTRTTTEEDFNTRLSRHDGCLWREKGTEHKVLENGNIQRRLDDVKTWVIKINTLSELLKFTKKYGQLVFDEEEIEIYDDYRE